MILKREDLVFNEHVGLVLALEDDMKPDKIREPRYMWDHSLPEYPKVLRDKISGVLCHFKPDKNRDRALGPDFDFNPLNYPGVPDFSNYTTNVHPKKYFIYHDGNGTMKHQYETVIKSMISYYYLNHVTRSSNVF